MMGTYKKKKGKLQAIFAADIKNRALLFLQYMRQKCDGDVQKMKTAGNTCC
jgi:hypothetical protein